MTCVVIADGEVLENEIQSLIKHARILVEETGRPIDMNDELLAVWFEVNKNNITKALRGPDSDKFIMNTIIGLDSFHLKQILLNGLIRISASDADINRSETEIVNLAAVYWDLKPIYSDKF